MRVNVISNSRTDIQINEDGTGTGFKSLAAVFANLGGVTVDDLIASGQLVADHKLFASDF